MESINAARRHGQLLANDTTSRGSAGAPAGARYVSGAATDVARDMRLGNEAGMVISALRKPRTNVYCADQASRLT